VLPVDGHPRERERAHDPGEPPGPVPEHGELLVDRAHDDAHLGHGARRASGRERGAAHDELAAHLREPVVERDRVAGVFPRARPEALLGGEPLDAGRTEDERSGDRHDQVVRAPQHATPDAQLEGTDGLHFFRSPPPASLGGAPGGP
jgi:hypothetical protein